MINNISAHIVKMKPFFVDNRSYMCIIKINVSLGAYENEKKVK